MGAMAFREIGPVSVEVHGTQAPTEEEWNAFRRAARKATLHGCTKVLVVSAGWGPDSRQRAQAREIVGDIAVTVAVVTDSPVVRGIVTAFSWFHPRISAFALDRGAGIPAALRYLDVGDAMADRILREVHAMLREVGAA